MARSTVQSGAVIAGIMPDSKVPAGTILARTGKYTATAELDVNSTIQMVPMPKGAQIQDIIMQITALGAGRSLSVGLGGGALGTTLVTNGLFAAGIADWDDESTGDGSVAWDTDHMELDANTGTALAGQTITVEDGALYELLYTVAEACTSLAVTGGNAAYAGTQHFTETDLAVGAKRITFRADGTDLYLLFANATNEVVSLDDISLKKLPSNIGVFADQMSGIAAAISRFGAQMGGATANTAGNLALGSSVLGYELTADDTIDITNVAGAIPAAAVFTMVVLYKVEGAIPDET